MDQEFLLNLMWLCFFIGLIAMAFVAGEGVVIAGDWLIKKGWIK